LHRHYIGIEQDISYIELAQQRIASIQPEPFDETIFNITPSRRKGARISVGILLENGLLNPGQLVFFEGDRNRPARLRADGHLTMSDLTGSIHQVGRQLHEGSPCNGWEVWFFEDENGELHTLDVLRKKMYSILESPPRKPE
jgi:hypothetical protein